MTTPPDRVPSRTLAEYDVYLCDCHVSGVTATLDVARERVEKVLAEAGEGIRGRVCLILWSTGWHPWVRDLATERWATVRDGVIEWRPPWA